MPDPCQTKRPSELTLDQGANDGDAEIALEADPLSSLTWSFAAPEIATPGKPDDPTGGATDAPDDTPEILGYGVVTNGQAVIRDETGAKLGDGSVIPKNTAVQVVTEAVHGKHVDVLVRYRSGPGVASAWTRKSNLKNGKLLPDDAADRLLADKGDPGLPMQLPSTPLGYGLVTDTQANVRLETDAVVPNKRVPAGTFAEVLLERTPGKHPLVLLRYRRDGADVVVWTRRSNLKNDALLPDDEAERRLEARRAQIRSNVRELTLDDLAGVVEEAEDDSDVRAYRDARNEALTSTAPGALTTTPVDPAVLPSHVAAHLDDDPGFTTGIARALHGAANKAVFAAPGEGAKDGQGVAREHLAQVAEAALLQEAARRSLLADVAATEAHWAPQLQRFADGKDHKGLDALFRKKNKPYKQLAKNQRKQDRQALPAVGKLVDLLGIARNAGPALREVQSLVDGMGPVGDAIEAAPPAEVSLTRVPRLSDLPALPAPDGTADLDTWVHEREDWLKAAGVAELTVTAQTKPRWLAPKQNKVTSHEAEVTSEAPAPEALSRTLSELPPGEPWPEHLDLLTPSDRPIGWLTVAHLPDLLELDLPVYGDLGGGAVGSMHLGDRLGWTGRVQCLGGERWVEVAFGGQLGWVQARFTTGARQVANAVLQEQADAAAYEAQETRELLDVTSTRRDPDAPVEAPPGLSIRGYLVRRQPEAVPRFADVYADEEAGRVDGPAWQLLGETGPGSSARAEVVVDDAPAYVPRTALRQATDVDLLLNLPRLDDAQLVQVRDGLAHDGTIEPHRVGAYYERLLDIGPDNAGSASFSGEHADETAGLADALRSLGVRNPYPSQSYADALEMLRLERALAPGDLPPLLSAVGVGHSPLSADGVRDAVRAGQAVLVQDGGTTWRVSGIRGAQPVLSGPAGDRTVPADAVPGDVLGLTLSADLDGDADALDALQDRTRTRAEDRAAGWKDQYARTTQGESSWYLQRLRADPELKDQADLGDWLPAAEDAWRFVDSPDDKLVEVVARHMTAARAEDGLEPGPAWQAGRAFVEAWDGALQTDRSGLQEALVEELRKGLRVQLARTARKDLDAAKTYFANVSRLPDVLGKPLADEGLRDVFKHVLVTPGSTEERSYADRYREAKRRRVAESRKAMAPTAEAVDERTRDGAVVADGALQTGDVTTVRVGSFSISLRATTDSGGRAGWVAYQEAARIDGEPVSAMPSAGQLEEAGFSGSTARLARVRAVGGDGGIGSKVNAYDAAYASFGVHQLTCVADSNGVSRVSEVLGHVLFDDDGAPREETARLRGALASVGVDFVQKGDDWAMQVDDDVLGLCVAGQGLSVGDLSALAGAGRYRTAAAAEPTKAQLAQILKTYKSPGTNRAAMAVATDPRRLGVLAAVFADPRVQAAEAISWTKHALKAGLDLPLRVGGTKHVLGDFPLDERAAGTASKLYNSASGHAAKICARAFAKLLAKHPAAKDPAAWVGGDAATYNAFLVEQFIAIEPQVRGADKHRAKDWQAWADVAEDHDPLQGTVDDVQTPGWEQALQVRRGTHLDPMFETPEVDPVAEYLQPLLDDAGITDHFTALQMAEDERRQGLANRPQTREALLEEARRIPFSLVYGDALAREMEPERDRAREQTIRDRLFQSYLLMDMGLDEVLPDGLEGLWVLKLAAEAAGTDVLANEVDVYLTELEAAVGHERAEALSPGTYYDARPYDPELAKQWLDELDEAYRNVKITVQLASGPVEVTLKAQYRNFRETLVSRNGDWMGVHAATQKMDKGYTCSNFTDVIRNGKGTDGVEHSVDFLEGWKGKARPAALQSGMQEAIDSDLDVQDELRTFETTSEAESYLYEWFYYKQGLDCVGFAWNAINGSGMFEDFTPVAIDKNGNYTSRLLTSDSDKKNNFACSGFKKVARVIADPEAWRTLDCMVSETHIIVIYDVERGERPGEYVLQTRESCGSKGYWSSTYIYDGKRFLTKNRNAASGGPYQVYRPQNAVKLDKHLAGTTAR